MTQVGEEGDWITAAEHPLPSRLVSLAGAEADVGRNSAATLPWQRQGPVNTSLPNSDKWYLLHQH